MIIYHICSSSMIISYYIINIMKQRIRSRFFSSFHYWASEKLFLFVFNESIRRVVDKSSELNKRSILPYRIKWNWMLPAPDLSSLRLTSLVGGLASWRLRFFLKQRNPRGWHAEMGSFPDSFSREPLNLIE